MKYILFILLVNPTPQTGVIGEYSSMDGCFEARDTVIERIGRPIINYQAVCVIKGENHGFISTNESI